MLLLGRVLFVLFFLPFSVLNCRAQIFISSLRFSSSPGAGEVWIQPPDDPVSWWRLPVPGTLLLLPRHGGDPQADGHRTQEHQQEDDRQAVQVQLGPQTVHRHPCQDCVGERGRPDHPQPPVAGQEKRCAKENGEVADRFQICAVLSHRPAWPGNLLGRIHVLVEGLVNHPLLPVISVWLLQVYFSYFEASMWHCFSNM